MKKVFALLLALMMLLSAGILSIADEEPEAAPAPVASEPAAEPAAVEAAEPAAEPAAEGEIPAEGELPIEGEIPAEGELPFEGEIPAEGELPFEGEIPAEGEAEAEELPEEETEEDPMAVIEIPEEIEVEFTGTIRVSVCFAGDELYYGDTVTLRASVKDANLPYSIRWEANAGSGWYKVGSGESYGFVVNEQNATYAYRAVLVVED